MKPSILHRLRSLLIVTNQLGHKAMIGTKRKRHGTHGAFGKSKILQNDGIYFRQPTPERFMHAHARGMLALQQALSART